MSYILKLCLLYFICFIKICHNINNNTTDPKWILESSKYKSSFFIAGGYRPPTHTLAKYVVSIRKRNRFNVIYKRYFGATHICGGTILSSHVILTAAHCLKRHGSKLRPSNLEVVAKTPKRLEKTKHSEVLEVRATIVHRRYSLQYVQCDIGLIKLKKGISLDGHWAAAIMLPSVRPKAQTTCTVVGWGKMYEKGPLANELLYVNVTIFSSKYCERVIPVFGGNKICAGILGDHQKDSCQGDSGGPLICNGTLTGIVSYGFGCASGHPAVYTDVFAYREWLKKSDGCALRNISVDLIVEIFIFVKVFIN